MSDLRRNSWLFAGGAVVIGIALLIAGLTIPALAAFGVGVGRVLSIGMRERRAAAAGETTDAR